MIVWIKIGSATTPFAVHRELLIKASAFFSSALNKPNIEAESDGTYHVTPEAGSHMVHLPNDSYEVFERFNHFLYAQKQLLREGEKADDLSWTHVIDVYIFAIKRQIPSLQNAIINISIRKHAEAKNLPSPSEINRLYRVGVKAPNLRALFIDLFIKDCNLEHTLRKHRNYHPQFLTAMLIKLYLKNQKAEESQGKGMRKKIKRDRYYVCDEEQSSPQS